MTAKRIAAVGIWMTIAPALAMGQQQNGSVDRVGPPSAPAERVVVRTYPLGGVLPSRTVETRHDAVVTQTIEVLDVDGRLAPTQEIITATARTSPAVVHIRRDAVGFVAHGKRTLLETTLSERETLPDGSTTTVLSTSTPDLNGRSSVTAREIQRTTLLPPDAQRTETAVFVQGVNEPLREVERLQQTERHVSADVHRTDGTLLLRDVNGRFQPTESWSQEVRNLGPSEYVQEQTIHRLDLNGKLTVSERHVTRHFEANGQAQSVTETFSRNLPGVVLSGDHLELSQRVHRTSTAAADGGGQTVEEVEERLPGSLSEPLRVVRRTVEATRRVNADHWQTERLVYIRDANGRLVLDVQETGDVTGR